MSRPLLPARSPVSPTAARSALLLVLAVLALWHAALPATAQVYRWKDADGVTHYSDSRPVAQTVEELPLAASGSVDVATAPAAIGAPAAAAVPPAPLAVRQPDIVMYQSPTCGWCRKAERYFAARGLGHRSVDITASPSNRAEFARNGGRGTPLIFVDGERVNGYNEARLDALLAQVGAR